MNVFTRFLKREGNNINLFDVDNIKLIKIAEKYEAKAAKNFSDAASKAEFVILCTPIQNTPKIIQEVSAVMKKDAILCEITSLKSKIVPSLKLAMSKESIQPLSIHPMFGPDADTLDKKNIIIIPIVNIEKEKKLIRLLFPNTNLIITEVEAHDSFMASILSLPYFMNLVFAKTLPLDQIKLLKQLAGPTFSVQLALSQSIIGESPQLITSLINENIFAKKTMLQFINESKYLLRILKNNPNKFEKNCLKLQEVMSQDPEYQFAREKRHDFIKY